MAQNWIKQAGSFAQQVKEETGKIVWPTRRDVVLTSIIVSIIAFMVSVFLFFVDQGVVSFLSVVL